MTSINYSTCTDLSILQARIEELETLLHLNTAPVLFNLSARENSICELLVARGMMTKTALYNIFYAGWSEIDPKVIDVFICKIRKKLPADIKIITIWGRGYHMPEESRKAWKAYCAIAKGETLDGNPA